MIEISNYLPLETTKRAGHQVNYRNKSYHYQRYRQSEPKYCDVQSALFCGAGDKTSTLVSCSTGPSTTRVAVSSSFLGCSPRKFYITLVASGSRNKHMIQVEYIRVQY